MPNHDRYHAMSTEEYAAYRDYMRLYMRKRKLTHPPTEEQKARHEQRRKERRKKNPEIFTARNKLQWAVRSGKIIRPKRCSRCKKKCKPHGHHADYSKELDVEWVCRLCHAKEHRIRA